MFPGIRKRKSIGFFCRTKWKRQTAVGLELLAEAGNFAAVQRMLQTNPYWAHYDPHTASLVSNMDALLLRQSTTAAALAPPSVPSVNAPHHHHSPAQLLPRMLLHGIQQHVTRIQPQQQTTYSAAAEAAAAAARMTIV